MVEEQRALYQQIYRRYQRKILSGELPEGYKLPSEAALMNQFGVSRITAKRALDELENDGYIQRRRGSGSYVSEKTTRSFQSRKEPLRVALIVPSAEHETNLFYTMIQGATDFLCQQHGQLVCYHSHRDQQAEQELLLQARADGCDGILYYPGPVETAKDILIRMAATHYPVVLLDKNINGNMIDSVASDNVKGSQALMSYVIEKGHRNIAFLSVSGEMANTAGERYMGCCRGMEQKGLPLECLHNLGVFDNQQEMLDLISCYNRAAEDRLVKLLPRWKAQGITAICTLNDNMAMRVYGAAKQLGYRIPEDMAVAGFDGAEYGAYVTPGLTSVWQNAYQMGYQGAQVLLERMQHPDAPIRRVLIEPELVVRQSV